MTLEIISFFLGFGLGYYAPSLGVAVFVINYLRFEEINLAYMLGLFFGELFRFWNLKDKKVRKK